jgi:DNA-binding NarL/FixJ family response regulator
VESATEAGALSAALEARPAAALVDVDLPDGDGYALAERLAGARVVLTSVNADAFDAAALARCGAVAFVPKAKLPETLTRELLVP